MVAPLRRKAVRCSKTIIRAVEVSERTKVSLAQTRCRFDERVEHRLKIERRAADCFQHVSGGGLLSERFTQLIQQPRVLDGDDCLRSEVLHQLDLLVGEGSNFLAEDGNYAD